MRDFIESIDWSKNIVFLLLYAGILVACASLYLLPVMDSYKSAVTELRKTDILKTQLDSAISALKAEQEAFLSENAEVFTKLQKSPDKSEITKYANKYLKDIKIAESTAESTESNITIRTFKISGKSQNLGKIKDLTANISTLQNSAKIAFPLTIRKEKNTLFVEISVEVYSKKESAQNTQSENLMSKE
ncbi:hypothetical protein ACWIUD_05520 [Helicobacter sp. 23-1044]